MLLLLRSLLCPFRPHLGVALLDELLRLRQLYREDIDSCASEAPTSRMGNSVLKDSGPLLHLGPLVCTIDSSHAR